MVMPMENVPEPGEWVEDWYTTWQSRKENSNTLKLSEMDENLDGSEDSGDEISESDTSRQERNNTESKNDDDSYWEEDQDVGTLRTVRLKVDERVSRVTWNHTSSLQRSRWRRKYFPKGTIPL